MSKQIYRKTLGFLAFTLALIASVPHAHAQTSRMYLSGYMGLNTFSSREFSHPTDNGAVEISNSVGFAGALGLRLTPNIRVEGEIAYNRSDFSNIIALFVVVVPSEVSSCSACA